MMISMINSTGFIEIGTYAYVYLRKNRNTSGKVDNVTNNKTTEIIAINTNNKILIIFFKCSNICITNY